MFTRLRTTAIILLALLLAAACSVTTPAAIVGSGRPATEQRSVDSFTGVSVSSTIQATVIVGPEVTVSVTADDNLLANVTTQVRGGQLQVSLNGSTTIRTPISVTITAPNIDSLQASSAASLTATGIATQSLSAKVDSAASIVARGNAVSVSVTAQSGGSADLGDVAAQTATVQLESAARATVNAQLSVAGSVVTAARLTIEGDPASVDVTTDSSGQVVRD